MTNNLLVKVVTGEGKKEAKLAGFVIGSSIVKELSKLNKTAKQDQIHQWATKFLTADQAALPYKCLVTEDKDPDAEVEAEVTGEQPAAEPVPPEASPEVTNG